MEVEASLGMVRRLYRSRVDRILCGVCGGIGSYVNVDPVVVRLLWVLITVLFPPIGVITYIAACLIVPEEPTVGQTGVVGQPIRQGINFRGAEAMAIGLALAILGSAILLNLAIDMLSRMMPPQWVKIIGIDERFKVLAGLALLGIGLALMLRYHK